MLVRIERSLTTVGYEGTPATNIVESLQRAGVDTLVDVRQNPISRKPGLSKKRFAETLRDARIGYIHFRELGNPRENRDSFRSGEASSLIRFREVLDSPAGEQALDELSVRMANEHLALFCYEREPRRCHRNIIANYLLAGDRRSTRVIHLMPLQG